MGFLGILGLPYYGISVTIRIGREMLCLPYAGFLKYNFQNLKTTRRYGPLQGPTSSSCRGLRQSAEAFFADNILAGLREGFKKKTRLFIKNQEVHNEDGTYEKNYREHGDGQNQEVNNYNGGGGGD